MEEIARKILPRLTLGNLWEHLVQGRPQQQRLRGRRRPQQGMIINRITNPEITFLLFFTLLLAECHISQLWVQGPFPSPCPQWTPSAVPSPPPHLYQPLMSHNVRDFQRSPICRNDSLKVSFQPYRHVPAQECLGTSIKAIGNVPSTKY